MFKRIVSFILLSVMLISPSVTTTSYAESSFSDVKSSDWFAPYVEQAKENNIIGGYPDGTFRPQGTVTYAEFLVMAMQGERSDKPSASTHWGAPYYTYAIEHRIFTADQISIDDLNKSIPRKDMAIIMAGVLKENNLGIKEPYPWAAILYKDIHSYNDWNSFDRQIALCSFYGCLSGYEDKTFRPYGNLTRAEAATAMVALLKAVDESKYMTLYADTPLPRPTDRTTLMNYMENYRPGIDYRYNGEMSPSVEDDPRMCANFTSDPTLMHAEAFVDPEIKDWALKVLNSVRFTVNKNNIVSVTFNSVTPPANVSLTDISIDVDKDISLYSYNSNMRNFNTGIFGTPNAYSGNELNGKTISEIQLPYLYSIGVSVSVMYNWDWEALRQGSTSFERCMFSYYYDLRSDLISFHCIADGVFSVNHTGGFELKPNYFAESLSYGVPDEVFAGLLQ